VRLILGCFIEVETKSESNAKLVIVFISHLSRVYKKELSRSQQEICYRHSWSINEGSPQAEDRPGNETIDHEWPSTKDCDSN